jgi:hypothetical protein
MSTTYTESDFIQFGAGYIYGLAVGGTESSVVIPGYFATIESASVDISVTVKELRGAFEDAEDLASASRKITGKITTGRINLSTINQLLFADTFATGATAISNLETQVVPSSPAGVVTVTNSATWTADLGVFYTGTRQQLSPVSIGTPLQGQYKVVAGQYTFAVADEGTSVSISYEYTTTTGHTLTLNNKIMGSSRPVFACYFSMPYNGNNDLTLFWCRATKLNIPEKREDYCVLDIEFMAGANPAGHVLQWCSSV